MPAATGLLSFAHFLHRIQHVLPLACKGHADPQGDGGCTGPTQFLPEAEIRDSQRLLRHHRSTKGSCPEGSPRKPAEGALLTSLQQISLQLPQASPNAAQHVVLLQHQSLAYC